MPAKLIIAHRGASKLEKENTLEAFQKAIDLGADVIELDVRQTKDGILAVFHDKKINNWPIRETPFDILNQITARQNYQVPTLDEALKQIAGKADLQIEIKAPGYELLCAQTALKYLRPENFHIISFHLEILKKIKLALPQINTGLIIGTWHTWVWQTLHFLFCKKQILSTVNLLAINTRLWQTGFGWLVPKNFPLTVWTADKPKLIKKLLADKHIMGITSNVPDLAIKFKLEYKI